MHDQSDSDQASLTRGKQKRISQELQDFGLQLLALPASDLRYFTLPEFVREAIEIARTIEPKNHGALRRQRLRIGSLMGEMDPQKLRDEFRLFHSLAYQTSAAVSWSDRLIEDDDAMTQLCEQFTEMDAQTIQTLRQMIRACKRARNEDKKRSSQAKLIDLLRKSNI